MLKLFTHKSHRGLPLVVEEDTSRYCQMLWVGSTICQTTLVHGKDSKSLELAETSLVIPINRMPLTLDEIGLDDLLADIDTSDSVSNSIEEGIIEHLIRVPEVVEVYFSQDGDVVDVWTVIDQSERRVRFAVYEKELEIRRRLPGLFINFRISGREASSSPASMGYRRVDFNVRRTNAGHQRPPRPGKA